MNLEKYLFFSWTVFAVSMIVSAIVSLLWNLSFHRAITIDWATSLRLAITFGIIVPWIETRRSFGK
jgi:hypothetical protein